MRCNFMDDFSCKLAANEVRTLRSDLSNLCVWYIGMYPAYGVRVVYQIVALAVTASMFCSDTNAVNPRFREHRINAVKSL